MARGVDSCGIVDVGLVGSTNYSKEAKIVRDNFREKVQLPTSFNGEKIHRRCKRKGITEVLVSWRGYPATFMQWLPQKDIQVIST